jgi:glycosyltransferase involved in cell wall biosynthesis
MTVNKHKRIAILADFPWSFFNEGATGRGGGQGATWLTQLATEFSSVNRYEIQWVILDRTKMKSGREFREWGGQVFHRLPGCKLSLDLLFGYRPARKQLFRVLNELAPDLIHCWGSERAYPIACGAFGVPSVFSVQGVLTHLARQGLLPKIWQWKAIAGWESVYLKAATVVTAESAWAAERIREVASGLDIRQVEYGVHPEFYNVVRAMNRESPYALFVGTLSHAKGVDMLLNAMEAIEPRTWKLKLAGEGPLQQDLAARSVPGVEWLGNLRWDALQAELAGATCLVLPTRADSSPNVVKEARVVGVPVITTSHGGQAGYVFDGQNGLIVKSPSVEELAQALSRLMDNPGLAEQMGAARHDIDRAYFRPERTAESFIRIYDELLGL